MGSSFFGGIYKRDPIAQSLGLHNPSTQGDASWMPTPQYSGATPSLGDAMAGYGTNNLAPGQYAGAGQARDPNDIHPLAMPGTPGASGGWGSRPNFSGIGSSLGAQAGNGVNVGTFGAAK